MSEVRASRQPLVSPGAAELHVRDMTATFAADMTLAETQRRLAEVGQWLPIDGPEESILGRLVEHDSTGPLRLGYGAWRDLLLGVQFTNGAGELITAGGRTVKNVAGYDLTKFMVGQHGVFGKLVTLTTRTYRRPAGALLAKWEKADGVIRQLLPTSLRPQWSLMTREGLFCGYLGDQTSLDWYELNVRHASPMEVVRRSLEEDDAHRRRVWRFIGGGTFRASFPPARIAEAVRYVTGDWAADPTFGIVTGEVGEEAMAPMIRAWAASHGGTVRFTRASSSLAFDYSATPGEQALLRRLKAAFDPAGTLAPLQGGGR
jgi:FAD/FMN-containing dehydrogenase